MYIVRNKKTKKIIHLNPAPSTQKLKDKEVYFKFNRKTMEMGKTEGDIPEYFDINKKGEIVELTPGEKVRAGIITLKPEQKIANNRIVEKTLSQKIAEGLIMLAPNQKIVGEEIMEKTDHEMLAEGLMKLADYKQKKIEYFSALSFKERMTLIPDYKLQNGALGIYEEKTRANLRATIQAFRDEFYRIKKLVIAAKTVKEIDKIRVHFPQKMIIAKPK